MTQPQPITIDPAASWLPDSIRNGGARVYRFTFTAGERRIFRKKAKIPVSEWAEKHRYVTMSALPGPWRNEIAPYLSGIMDASFHSAVQTVIVCKAPQVGCTEAVLNCIGYAADRDPGPVLAVYPDEKTARENSQDRIQPMFEASPRLRSLLTGMEDDKAALRIKLKGMIMYMAWATSASRLSNKPIRYAVLDELDKYPKTAGKREAAPEALAEIRTTTYRWNRKIWKISTPTIETGPIWKALTMEAQVIFDYWVQCPLCGELQLMRFSRETFRWPREAQSAESIAQGKEDKEQSADSKEHSADPEKIEAEGLAWYECEHCRGHWNDTLRDQAVRAGQWRERLSDERAEAGETALELSAYLDEFRPRKIGFHIPSWISYFVSLSEVAAAFLKSQHDLEDFKNFKNKYEAVPWKRTVISSSEEQILKARCDLPAQTIPAEAFALTCGVDVQKHGFWFLVRAWAADLTNWNIHYGFLATWDDVEKLLFETRYPWADSNRSMRIFRACVDTGGGKKYENMTMTEETYFWLIKNRGRGGVALWGTKGSSVNLPGMLKLGSAITSTPAGKKLPGELRLLSIDTEKAKDQFHNRLNLAVENLSGGAYLHADTGTDYAAQILAEEKQITEKGWEKWVNVHQRDNHLIDCECLAAACAEMEFPGGGLRVVAEQLKKLKAQQGTKGHKVISKGL